MTANDSDVSDGETLTGSQVVRVYGENLTAPFVTLTFGDVVYTPLARGEDYIEFILGNNGTAIINVDGSRFMSFEVEGIVIPSILPTQLIMRQVPEDTWATGSAINRMAIIGTCIQYGRMVIEGHESFRLDIEVPRASFSASAVSAVNCTIFGRASTSDTTATIIVTPIEPTEVAYITYQDFIIAVFNYTTD